MEQHTLVTEIRELVFPEDRTRYDELVYSRDPYLSDRERDRHRVSVFVFDKLFACKNMLPVRFLVNIYNFYIFTFYARIPTFLCVQTFAQRFQFGFVFRKAFFCDWSFSLVWLDEIEIETEIGTQSK